MKRFLIICIPVCLLVFPACKKAKGPANVGSVKQKKLDSTVHMYATVNGAEWKTDSAYGYNVKNSANDTSVSNLLITATNYTNGISTIKFNITRYTGLGTYTINPPVNTATYYDVNNMRHFATAGTIVFATDTAYALRGTFSFTADTMSVINGEFDVALP